MAADGLVTLSEEVLSRASVITTWFDAPDSAVIPRVLVDEVERACMQLGLGERAAVLAVAGPSDFETFIGDFHQALFGERSRIRFDADLPSDFVLTTLPRREAASPRWWPVVLGHELAHLKLDSLAAMSPVGDPNGEPRPVDPLASLGLRDVFPWAEVERTAVEAASRGDQHRQFTDQETADLLESYYEIANNWLTELVCDTYMVHRFGPAGVAAMGSFLWGIGASGTASETHPSGLLRVQFMLELIRDCTDEDGIFESILRPWREVSSSGEPDARESEPPEAARSPEDVIWRTLRTMQSPAWSLVSDWDGAPPYDPRDTHRQAAVRVAQRQLFIGLPPHDAVPDELPNPPRMTLDDAVRTSAVATLSDEDVINAAWAVAADPDPLADRPRPPFDRLALKSVDMRAQWRSRKYPIVEPHPLPAGRPKHAGGNEAGVLTRDALVARTERTRDPWERIVLVPFIRHSVRNAAIDVHLGTRFITFQRSGTSVFAATRMDSRAVQRLIEKGWDDRFVLHPGEMVLASTLEYVAVPNDLAAQVITRSSYGRLGLITATAVQVHPLYRGCLTLELVNLGSVPLGLKPGERIAQLVFTTARPPRPIPASEDLFRGKYVCATEPQFSRVDLDSEDEEPADQEI